MLLTTVPLATVEQYVEKRQRYAQRWGIEVLPRILKSGRRIEDRQLGNADCLEVCLTVDLVVAWAVYQLGKCGREVPRAPCTANFEQPQWQSSMIFTQRDPMPPRRPPTLREAMRRVAGLGGFLGRKSDGEPSTECLWRGLKPFDDITEASLVFVHDPPHRRVSNRDHSG
jgi:hypothetical protein